MSWRNSMVSEKSLIVDRWCADEHEAIMSQPSVCAWVTLWLILLLTINLFTTICCKANNNACDLSVVLSNSFHWSESTVNTAWEIAHSINAAALHRQHIANIRAYFFSLKPLLNYLMSDKALLFDRCASLIPFLKLMFMLSWHGHWLLLSVYYKK